MCNAGSAVGNIVGPLLFNKTQAPEYHKGLGAVLGIFIACAALSGYVQFNLFLNPSPSLLAPFRLFTFLPSSFASTRFPSPFMPFRNTFTARVALILLRILMFLIKIMNNAKEKIRVSHGKPAKLYNSSMAKEYTAGPAGEVDSNGNRLGDQAFADMTDKENDEVSGSLLCFMR